MWVSYFVEPNLEDEQAQWLLGQAITVSSPRLSGLDN